jgi:hypothetical protein
MYCGAERFSRHFRANSPIFSMAGRFGCGGSASPAKKIHASIYRNRCAPFAAGRRRMRGF